MEHQNLLVFLEFPDPAHPSLGLLKSLSYMDITLVGFRSVSRGEKLDTARREEIETTLTEIASEFESRGIRVETHVESGPNMKDTRDEWARREEIDGILTPGGVGTVGRVLVGVRDTQHVERMVQFVDLIDRDRIIHITLLHVAPETEPESGHGADGRKALELMKTELTKRGVNPHAIDMQIQVSDDRKRELLKTARTYDLTVLGPTEEPGLEERVFGPMSNRVANRADSAVLVVG